MPPKDQNYTLRQDCLLSAGTPCSKDILRHRDKINVGVLDPQYPHRSIHLGPALPHKSYHLICLPVGKSPVAFCDICRVISAVDLLYIFVSPILDDWIALAIGLASGLQRPFLLLTEQRNISPLLVSSQVTVNTYSTIPGLLRLVADHAHKALNASPSKSHTPWDLSRIELIIIAYFLKRPVGHLVLENIIYKDIGSQLNVNYVQIYKEILKALENLSAHGLLIPHRYRPAKKVNNMISLRLYKYCLNERLRDKLSGYLRTAATNTVRPPTSKQPG